VGLRHIRAKADNESFVVRQVDGCVLDSRESGMGEDGHERLKRLGFFGGSFVRVMRPYRGFLGGIVVGFGLSRWDVPDGAEEPVIIEPVDPAQVASSTADALGHDRCREMTSAL
jgi:hypothetical protein